MRHHTILYRYILDVGRQARLIPSLNSRLNRRLNSTLFVKRQHQHTTIITKKHEIARDMTKRKEYDGSTSLEERLPNAHRACASGETSLPLSGSSRGTSDAQKGPV